MQMCLLELQQPYCDAEDRHHTLSVLKQKERRIGVPADLTPPDSPPADIFYESDPSLFKPLGSVFCCMQPSWSLEALILGAQPDAGPGGERGREEGGNVRGSRKNVSPCRRS